MEAHKNRGRPREFDRQKALCAALRLFWEKGYEPASVSELCAAMGINPPSLYAAFGNKSALFIEACHHYEHIYWDDLGKQLQAQPDVRIAIAEYFQNAARLLLSPDAPCGCLVTLGAVNISDSETEIIAELKKMREAPKRMFAERLRQAIVSGQIPADTDVPALAGALCALLDGLALQAREGLFLSELKAMAAFSVRLLPPETGSGKVRSAALLSLL